MGAILALTRKKESRPYKCSCTSVLHMISNDDIRFEKNVSEHQIASKR